METHSTDETTSEPDSQDVIVYVEALRLLARYNRVIRARDEKENPPKRPFLYVIFYITYPKVSKSIPLTLYLPPDEVSFGRVGPLNSHTSSSSSRLTSWERDLESKSLVLHHRIRACHCSRTCSIIVTMNNHLLTHEGR